VNATSPSLKNSLQKLFTILQAYSLGMLFLGLGTVLVGGTVGSLNSIVTAITGVDPIAAVGNDSPFYLMLALIVGVTTWVVASILGDSIERPLYSVLVWPCASLALSGTVSLYVFDTAPNTGELLWHGFVAYAVVASFLLTRRAN
jgi:hypothetical protein